MDKLVNYLIWILSHDFFQEVYTNWRVSRDNLIYAILVGNQNIFMWKSLLVYIAYFILYREYGQLGELFNMDPLPWLLQRFRCEVGNSSCEINCCLWERYCCRHVIKHKSMKWSEILWMKTIIYNSPYIFKMISSCNENL